MLCDVCHAKEATVHLTEIINNKITKLHLCEQCAREKSEEMEEHFGLADLLSGLADFAPVVETAGPYTLNRSRDRKQGGSALQERTFTLNLTILPAVITRHWRCSGGSWNGRRGYWTRFIHARPAGFASIPASARMY